MRLLVDEHGESGASARLGIERRTIARYLPRVPLYPGTYALVTQKVAALRAEAA